ncbi:MAG: SLC13 family permease [Planctomycetota bacterium]
MSNDQLTVLAILGSAVLLFVRRVRVDLVAVLVVLALTLTGICTPARAVAGFGSTVVVMIASLLVVGDALARTGVANVVGGWIARIGRGNEGRTRTTIILASGLLGSVMNSTAVVALFLPVVIRVGQEQRIPPGRLLLPLAYGVLISGMMTLIGTAPNLIVHAELLSRHAEGFHFFDFTPIGAAVLIAAALSFGVGARYLLPAPPESRAQQRRPRMHELWGQFVPDSEMTRLTLSARSPLIGKRLSEAALGSRFGVWALAIERPNLRALTRHASLQPNQHMTLQVGDVLTVAGTGERLAALGAEPGITSAPLSARNFAHLDRDLGVAVVVIPPDSELIGKTLTEASFRARHNLYVAGVRRDGEPLSDFAHVALRTSDSLLVMGPWTRIAKLQEELRDFVVLTLPAELATAAHERARMPIALLIVALMVVASALGILPVMTSALAAAVLLVITRCIPISEAYRGIQLSSLVLIAGMLPLAQALSDTGLLKLAVEGMTALMSGASPRAMIAMVFLTTAGLGSIVSNSATAVLMGPIAIGLAEATGVQPQAFAMTVAIAASSAYLTPMASPVMTLVVEPGGYVPKDFMRAGMPLMLATLAICVALIPWLFPL